MESAQDRADWLTDVLECVVDGRTKGIHPARATGCWRSGGLSGIDGFPIPGQQFIKP